MVPVMSKLIAEFLGTFLLVFTIGCNVLGGSPLWAPVSIAAVLMVSIYNLGGISGANFNPAVSAALAISKAMGNNNGLDFKLAGMYAGVQILGGLVAAFAYRILYKDYFNLAPSKTFDWQQAGFCEVLYTFMLTFVVLNVAAVREKNEYYGLAIGFVIVAGAYGAGLVSGGCFNPAVAIGIDASSAAAGFYWCIPYACFELIGAAIAAFLFKVVRPEECEPAIHISRPAPSLVSKLVSEFLGTYMLVVTVGLNVLGKSLAGAFSIAASLMCMIYALGGVSGAHFNPAVTVAIFLSGKHPSISPADAGAYILTQIAAGVMGALSYSAIYSGESFDLGPKAGFGWSDVMLGEVVFTFVLCMVVLGVAVSDLKSGVMFGLAIGSCVTVGGFAIGSVSGGSLNPAVSFGIASPHVTSGSVTKAFIYTICELIGGALAAGVFRVTHADEISK